MNEELNQNNPNSPTTVLDIKQYYSSEFSSMIINGEVGEIRLYGYD